MGHSDQEGSKRTEVQRSEIPFFSREKRPEFRKRDLDLYEPLLIGMAQVLPCPIRVLQSLVLHLFVNYNELQLQHTIVLELIRIRDTARLHDITVFKIFT